MIDDFLEEQNIVCKILKNAVKKENYSHAYLFETNGYYAKDLLTNAFIKHLLCPNKYSNNKECANCNQCFQIDNNIFSEVKHIYPDGLWIKKEQLDELQKNFSTKGIGSNKKVYVIHEAEKMNVQASNSILKFLEEPEDNIIAILITDNMYQLLDTIISRCQIISFSKIRNTRKNNIVDNIRDNVSLSNTYQSLEDGELHEKINYAINFVNIYEKKGKDIFLSIQKNFISKINDKDDLIFNFDVMILYYNDIIHYLINKKVSIFTDFIKEIEFVSEKNDLKKINSKINKIINCKNLVKYNVNTNLLLDKLIIELERSE